jgi:uncharacterized SAM-binding protein YcdF (DUF218 family)
LKLIRTLFTLIVIVGIAALAGRLLMPYAAKQLMRSDPLQRADIIVVLGSSRYERTIEAGTLFREGWAPRILLMRPSDETRDSTRDRLGLHFPVFLDTQRDVLNQMHVPPSAVALSPTTQESTRDEAVAVADYARQNGFRRIIIVTSPYHTARAGQLCDRAAKGSFEIVVHPDRYEPAHPDRWWTFFPDRTDVVLEYLKRIYVIFYRG